MLFQANFFNPSFFQGGTLPFFRYALCTGCFHAKPQYAYGICKIFVLCNIISGNFKENSETSESGFFAFENLPLLAEEKNTAEQIKMCFDAYHDDNWTVRFD